MNETPQILARHCGQINQNAHFGSWHLDLGSQLLTCSDEACRVLGLDVGAPIAFERFLQCIHPEDRPLFDRACMGRRVDVQEADPPIGGATGAQGIMRWVASQLPR